MINCTCPECEVELEVSDRKLGKMVECPECGSEFEVARKKRAKKRRRGGNASPKLRTADLRRVALYQRLLLFCVLAQIGVGVGQFAIPEESRLLLLIVALPVILASVIFVYLLASELYGALGILLAILEFVPLLGLIILLMVNQKATGLLQSRGYRVGLLGAPLSQFDDSDDDEDDE